MTDDAYEHGSSVDRAGTPAIEDRARGLVRRLEHRVFDDDSPNLDRFGSLLALAVASIVVLSVIDIDAISDSLARGVLATILSTTTGITLVLALRASGVAPRSRRVAEVAVVFAFVGSILALLVEQFSDAELGAWQTDRPSPMWVAIAVVTPFAVVRRLVKHRRVSGGTLAGAIAAYLLIAIAFCYLFLYVDGLTDDTFFGTTADVSTHDFMYFSLVTITTVGYGDLSPDGQVGRLLATSEAVIGQVYLVTFVAMLVGLMIAQRETVEPPRSDDPSREA